MKRFILFLIVPLLYGCEKYELPSSILQQLSAPTPFYLKSYRIQIKSNSDNTDIGRFGIDSVDVVQSSEPRFVGLGDWNVVGINGSGDRYIIRCDTTGLSSHKKYVIGDQWNFGNPNIYGLKIYDNLTSRIKGSCSVFEGGNSSNFIYNNLLTITDNRTNETNPGFSASTNSRGVGYATELYLTTPEQTAVIKEGQRVIGRFQYTVELLFNRN
jgi:hypothetical protein